MNRLSVWVLRFTNAELSDAFEAACDEYYAGNPGTIPRMDVLHEEIKRREAIGLWTEDDWIDRSK